MQYKPEPGDSSGIWYVSNLFACNPAGLNLLAVRDTARTPDLITGEWKEADNGSWVDSPGVTVTCGKTQLIYLFQSMGAQ